MFSPSCRRIFISFGKTTACLFLASDMKINLHIFIDYEIIVSHLLFGKAANGPVRTLGSVDCQYPINRYLRTAYNESMFNLAGHSHSIETFHQWVAFPAPGLAMQIKIRLKGSGQKI